MTREPSRRGDRRGGWAVTEAYELSGEDWARLAATSTRVGRPDAAAVAELVGVADGAAADRLIDSHLPLADLMATLAPVTQERRSSLVDRLGLPAAAPPFVVGVTGGVAAGKTVTAQVLQAILAQSGERRVEVVGTDGFLFSNAELHERGLMERKGYPESYDHAALVRFLAAVKAAAGPVSAPLYDHVLYDVTGEHRPLVERPDLVIVEGVNVLQPAPTGVVEGEAGGLLISDFLDFSVYVDADEPDVRRWFLRRLQDLRARSAGDDTSFFAGFAGLSDDDFTAMGDAVWESVNRPNLEHHIAPTRHRADLTIDKAADHSVRRVLVRRR